MKYSKKMIWVLFFKVEEAISILQAHHIKQIQGAKQAATNSADS
jgi:hypothetical protein